MLPAAGTRNKAAFTNNPGRRDFMKKKCLVISALVLGVAAIVGVVIHRRRG